VLEQLLQACPALRVECELAGSPDPDRLLGLIIKALRAERLAMHLRRPAYDPERHALLAQAYGQEMRRREGRGPR